MPKRHCSERDKQSHIDQASRRGEAGELLTRRTSTKNDTDSEIGQLLKKERHDTHFRERRDVRFQAQRSREQASSQYDCNEKERRLAESSYGLSEPRLQPEHAHWSEQEANAKYDQEIECRCCNNAHGLFARGLRPRDSRLRAWL